MDLHCNELRLNGFRFYLFGFDLYVKVYILAENNFSKRRKKQMDFKNW